ncbi:MAG: carboxypeptidase-like regulatory domain-containing protein [Solirubrobacterales bacterium]
MGRPKRAKLWALVTIAAMTAFLFLPFTPQVSAQSAEWIKSGASGITYDAEGKAIPGVTVYFWSPEAGKFAVVSDSNGYYRIDGLWGYIDYRAEKAGWTFECTEPTVDSVGNMSNLNFIGTPVQYRLSGRVTTASGQPIPDVTICFFDGQTPIPANPAAAPAKFTPVKTDKEGKWAKEGLSGSVTVMPFKTDWTFSARYMLARKESVVMNFIGTRNASGIPAVQTAPEKKPETTVKPAPAPQPQAKKKPAPKKRVFRPIKGKQNVTK